MLNSIVLLIIVIRFHFEPGLLAMAAINFIYQTAKSIADNVVYPDIDK